MKTAINLTQGSPEWKEFRRNMVMASEAPIILGLSPWKTPLQLYSDKINGTESIQTEAMRRGLSLESEARAAFEQLTGHFVYPAVLVHPDIPWMGASYDGINEEGIVMEAKCPGQADHDLALKGIIPEKYKAQLQHQMCVAQVSSAYYFSYRPQDPQPCALVPVTRDLDFIRDMLIAEKEFWDRLQSKTPPEPTERDVQFREDRAWLMAEEELFRLTVMIDELEEKKEEKRKSMIEMCDGRMTKGYRLKLTPVTRKGNIDYSRIELLKTLDLEYYRKPETITWRVDTL